jgi:hypothetical protein
MGREARLYHGAGRRPARIWIDFSTYCSNACKQRAYRQRRKVELEEVPR